MSQVVRYSSSLRACPVEETLEHARRIGQQVGITRVTDTTPLDRVGIPVFASIRPTAAPGSLCVSAGKGLIAAEARIGAYMEAIELAYAEYGRSALRPTRATARALLDGATRRLAVLDFCPVIGANIDLDAPLDCVEATDVHTGERTLVPAEVIFMPLPRGLGGSRYFSSDGNGLCSGNTVEEATLHGLAELIERDACSFYNIHDSSRLVRPDTLPAFYQEHADRLASRGFALHARLIPSQFEVPVFVVMLTEEGVSAVHLGVGCHPVAELALTRALCEAAQSRLTLIHGGRDDLSGYYQRLAALSPDDKRRYFNKVAGGFARTADTASYSDAPDLSARCSGIKDTLELLRGRLAQHGHRVLRVVYTPEELPLQVVRVLAPGLEIFIPGQIQRCGPRLKDYHARFNKKMPAVRGTDPASGSGSAS